MTPQSKLIDNLAAVRNRIDRAARRSGRSADDITLVAVTKYVTADIALELAVAGCRDLGESRPQELWAKAERFAAWTHENISERGDKDAIHWHLIGHLQRNKVQRTLPLVSLIHSGDSVRILTAIDQAAAQLKRTVPVFIEVNTSGDATKHGFKPAEVEPALPHLAGLSWLQISGLMCMASREGDFGQARREFASLRELRDRLQKIGPPNLELRELSMGMSADFEVAIEEGATMIRVGSVLFEGLPV